MSPGTSDISEPSQVSSHLRLYSRDLGKPGDLIGCWLDASISYYFSLSLEHLKNVAIDFLQAKCLPGRSHTLLPNLESGFSSQMTHSTPRKIRIKFTPHPIKHRHVHSESRIVHPPSLESGPFLRKIPRCQPAQAFSAALRRRPQIAP